MGRKINTWWLITTTRTKHKTTRNHSWCKKTTQENNTFPLDRILWRWCYELRQFLVGIIMVTCLEQKNVVLASIGWRRRWYCLVESPATVLYGSQPPPAASHWIESCASMSVIPGCTLPHFWSMQMTHDTGSMPLWSHNPPRSYQQSVQQACEGSGCIVDQWLRW